MTGYARTPLESKERVPRLPDMTLLSIPAFAHTQTPGPRRNSWGRPDRILLSSIGEDGAAENTANVADSIQSEGTARTFPIEGGTDKNTGTFGWLFSATLPQGDAERPRDWPPHTR